MNTVRIFLWLVPFLATRCACETMTWCPPAQEGTTHNISCFNNYGEEHLGLIWRAVTPTGTYSVAYCEYFNSQYDYGDGDGSCFVSDSSSFSATFIDGYSNLIINSVSKTTPFNMETTWNCYWRAGWTLTVCDPLQINEAHETTPGEIPMSGNTTASSTENPQESANTTETLLISTQTYTTERPPESINITENSGESTNTTETLLISTQTYTTERPPESINITENSGESTNTTENPAESTNITENLPESTYSPPATSGAEIPSESTMTTDNPLWTAGTTENATDYSSVTDGASKNTTEGENGAMARSGNFLLTITVLLFIKGALS